ncbi:beta-galactosidase, partial [Streptomyces sp900116325]|uniref:beta-galactosidase n=1 Tax=Streptomyces sp. 900116325 TaxID=3154295 RepID=UPI0033B7408B
NEAWGTAFWGQRYRGLDEIDPPRATPTVANPGPHRGLRRPQHHAASRSCH